MGMFVCTPVCARAHAHVCACACLCIRESAGSFKGAKYYTNKNVHPLIHGLTVCPSFLRAAARVCACARVFVRARGWGRSGWGGRGGWRRRAKESFNNLATNICIPQSTGGLFFALLYLSKENRGGGEKKLETSRKAAHFCVFVCRDLCVRLQTFIMSAFPLIDPLIKNMNNGGIKKDALGRSRPH